MDTSQINLKQEWPEETCPNCGRVHRGERVDIRGRDGTIYWIGCVACFGSLTKQLPIAFEMAEAINNLVKNAHHGGRFDPEVYRRLHERWAEAIKSS